ncbi:hypothetical protein SAMN05444157_2752 [Frankineae bacterium MT45]|nr:hypothetical protein SAMN05444157_2752 [Frankineae bacterium MT45]
MLATLYLIAATVAGFSVMNRLLPAAPTIVRLPAGLLVGIVVTAWTTFGVAYLLAPHTGRALLYGVVTSLVFSLIVIGIFGRNLRPRHLRVGWFEAIFAVVSFVFSYWMIGNRLSYDPTGKHYLLVSANTWGDFGLHIALSRSFSLGSNYAPTEYPFFAGEPIRYHFGYDFFAGALQSGGMSVLNSFNLPATLGFTTILLMLFATARLLFGPKTDAPVRWWRDKGIGAGLIAALLAMTNQSLEWLRFISNDAHGSIWAALHPSLLWKHTGYLSGGPYTNDRISMFNSINVYMTQTHLIVAMGFVLFIAYALLDQLRNGVAMDRRLLLFLGVTFGMSFWLNGVLWIAAAVFFGSLLAIYALCACWRERQNAAAGAKSGAASGAASRATSGGEWLAARREGLRWIKVGACFLIPALLIGVPQAIWLNGGSADGGSLTLHIGYLVCSSTTAPCHARGEMNLLSLTDWSSFVQYWWLNEGLLIPLLILAFVLGNRRDKKVITAITAIFIWGSLFQLGRDLGGQNHKVINLWENLSGLFVGFVLVELWTIAARIAKEERAKRRLVSVVARVGVVFMLIFLTVSGLPDFMAAKNDFKVSVFGDDNEHEIIHWIDANTPGKSIFLVDYDQLYTAPTMAGRGIVLGYSSWASSAGYDIAPREALIKAVYEATDRSTACSLLTSNGIDYVVVGPEERSTHNFKLNAALFDQFVLAKNAGGPEGYSVYDVRKSC